MPTFCSEQNVLTSKYSSLATHLIALTIYAFISVVATWPTILHFNSKALGELYIDRAQNIWNIWWIKTALLDLHTNPFQTDFLLYPGGADLYFHALNLPGGLMGLVPLLLFGPVAAYNFVALLGLTLSGYAGFRLAYYLTGSWWGGLVGGLIVGFNPLSLEMLRGQINLVNLQWFLLCIEFYLRTWSEGQRRDGVLTGLFFVLALLTVGYFEVQLLLIFAIHILWLLFTGKDKANWRENVRTVTHRAKPLLWWGGSTAALLALPYLLGAFRSLQGESTASWSGLDEFRTVRHSADLISFFVPNRSHWLLGEQALWWPLINNPQLYNLTYLGIVSLGLSILGIWSARRLRSTRFWMALGLIGASLAMGPFLQVNQQSGFLGMQVPLPFSLVRLLPPFGLVRAPERFSLIAYLALAILAAVGIRYIILRLGHPQRTLTLAVVFCLLFLDMPLHYRYTEAMQVPSSLAALASDPTEGALLELPITHHGWVDAPRMFYQTGHGRPIPSAYLSRNPSNPHIEACSPLKAFNDFPQIVSTDIISPAVTSHMLPLLNQANVGFIAVYKVGFGDRGFMPAPADQYDRYLALAEQLGSASYEDQIARVYHVRDSKRNMGNLLQLGDGWHGVEDSGGRPFRWIERSQADLCVFSTLPHTSAITLEAVSFSSPRHLQVWVGDKKTLEIIVPHDQPLQRVTTPPIEWPAGAQRVRLVIPEASSSPFEADIADDTRQISIGVANIRLGNHSP